MDAEILAVGTELLMGQIANTNAQYISSKLPAIGINVYFHSVVGDNAERLKRSLTLALQRSELVIMTGGLGPTMDDLTKEAVSELFGRKLELHEESLSSLRERMARFGSGNMPASNEKQAYFPEGSTVLPNANGTAPGCIVEGGGKTVVMLPGPPSEMRPMFDGQVMPFLAKYAECCLESRFLRIFGIGESVVEDMLRDLIEDQTNPTLATYAKEGEVTLRVTARYSVRAKGACVYGSGEGSGTGSGEGSGEGSVEGSSEGSCEGSGSGKGAAAPPGKAAGPGYAGGAPEGVDILSPVLEEARRRFGSNLYSEDNEELEAAALRALTKRGLTLALAESCTGGLASARLTAMPGASKALLMSAVTYSNEAKMRMLGVNEETLRAFGAVSRQTAEEMAIGARAAAGSDIAVSITGIAGPDGGTAEKPVGLVCLALADGSGVRSREVRTVGPRNRVRNISCLHAFDMIRRSASGLGGVAGD
jgi:nicotinamide-nucleotide amidase